MNFLKKLIAVGVELAVLYFIMWVVAKEWIFPTVNEPAWLDLIFLVVFFLASGLYLILRFFRTTKGLKKNVILVLSILEVGGTIYLSILFEIHLWVLILLPIPLFLLHLGIAKLLAKGK